MLFRIEAGVDRSVRGANAGVCAVHGTADECFSNLRADVAGSTAPTPARCEHIERGGDCSRHLVTWNVGPSLAAIIEERWGAGAA